MDQSEAQTILGLPDLERARVLKRLVEKLGRQSDVAEALGVNQGKISQCLSLLKLCDEARKLMDPSLPEGERLYFGSACFLAQRDKELQRVAIKDLRKSASPKEQIAHMRRKLRDHYDAKHLNKLAAFVRPPLFGEEAVPKPEPVAKVVEPVAPNPVQLSQPKPPAPQPELRQSPPTPARMVSNPFTQSSFVRARVVTESVTPRPLPRLDLDRQKPAPRKPTPEKIVARPTFERAAPPQSSSTRPVKLEPAASFNLNDLVIEYWDGERLLRYISARYDPQRYADLWNKKLLMFQREGKPRPEKYPDLDAADS